VVVVRERIDILLGKKQTGRTMVDAGIFLWDQEGKGLHRIPGGSPREKKEAEKNASFLLLESAWAGLAGNTFPQRAN